VNLETGATTKLFSTDGEGSFSSTTLYQSYGAGGGSMYSSTGTLLDTFALPAGSYTNPFPALSASYVDYTPDGHVFVFDTTGAHQYTVVPEPSAWGFLSGFALLTLPLMRRRSRGGGGRALILAL
jgi:hypothetical protein